MAFTSVYMEILDFEACGVSVLFLLCEISDINLLVVGLEVTGDFICDLFELVMHGFEE